MSEILDLVHRSRLDARINGPITQHVYHRTDRIQRSVRVEEVWRKAGNLGRGGFGEVYLEQSIRGPKQGELRAVKKLHKSNTDVNRELFAIALFSDAKYEHCFVQSFGWYELGSDIFIAMEYLQNGHLGNCFKSALPEEQVQSIVSQVLEGVDYMHDFRLAHRDLKPENILVVRQGPLWWVKLADFGISKRVGEDQGGLRTQVGTASFVAPEVLLSSRNAPYTIAVDLWSTGVITFLLLTGETIFTNEWTVIEYANGRSALPLIFMSDKGVSEVGLAFVQSLLQAQPDKRPSAREARGHEWLHNMYDVSQSKAEDWYGLAEMRSQTFANSGAGYSGRRSSASKAWSTHEPQPAGFGMPQYAFEGEYLSDETTVQHFAFADQTAAPARYNATLKNQASMQAHTSSPGFAFQQSQTHTYVQKVSPVAAQPMSGFTNTGELGQDDSLLASLKSSDMGCHARYGPSATDGPEAQESGGAGLMTAAAIIPGLSSHGSCRSISNDSNPYRSNSHRPALPPRGPDLAKPKSSATLKSSSGGTSSVNSAVTQASPSTVASELHRGREGSAGPNFTGLQESHSHDSMVVPRSLGDLISSRQALEHWNASQTTLQSDTVGSRERREMSPDEAHLKRGSSLPKASFSTTKPILDGKEGCDDHKSESDIEGEESEGDEDEGLDDDYEDEELSDSQGQEASQRSPYATDNPFEGSEVSTATQWQVITTCRVDKQDILVCQVQYSPSGHYMAATWVPSFGAGTCQIYDTVSWKIFTTIRNVGGDVIFSPDCETVAWFDPRRPEVVTWKISTQQESRRFAADTVLGEKTFGKMVDLGYGLPFTFSPNGERLAILSKIGALSIWDMPSGKRHCLVQADRGSSVTGWTRALGGAFVSAVVKFSSTGRLIASGSRHYDIVVRNAETGMICHRLRGHSNTILRLSFSSDEQYLVSHAYDNRVKTWQLSSQTVSYETTIGDANNMTEPADGRTFAIIDTKDGKATVTETYVATGKSTTFQAHEGRAGRLQYSPSGMTLVTASDDQLRKFWDGPNELQQCLDVEDEVDGFYFSPGGDLLAIVLQDLSIKVARCGRKQVEDENSVTDQGSLESLASLVADGQLTDLSWDLPETPETD